MIFRKLFEGVSRNNPYIEAAITMFENDESAEGIIVSVRPASDKKDKKVCRLYHSQQELNDILKKLQQTYGRLSDVSALHDRSLISEYKKDIQSRKNQENEDRVQNIQQSFNTRFENILKSNGLQYDTIIDTVTEKKYLSMYQQYVPKDIPESEEEQVKIINNFIKELKQAMNTKNGTPTTDVSTLQKFITLTKRLNKQLFFKDSNGNLKRVAPSKYDSIKPEQLANVFVTKTGKEEMSLASIIPQLKQDNLIEQIEKLYEENINMNNLIEDRKDEQPSDMITTRRYRPIPLSYRDKLQELGFKPAGRVGKWFKEYKGYCITVVERTNRQKLAVLVLEKSILRTDPTRGKELLAVEVYTEEQMVGKIKELESKIDTFRKDPYDRGVESIYEQMNRIDDEESLTEGVSNITKILNYTKNNLDRFNEYDSYEEWLDELNIDGVFDIPAKYCDDFENVTDEEAEAYIKMILSQGKLKQQLDDLKR